MGKAKKVGGNFSSNPIDKSKPTSSSKKSKAIKVKELGIFGCKKFIQERGIDLKSCINSYVHEAICVRKWNSWIDSMGIANETLVREFYHEFKKSTTFEDAVMVLRGVSLRVCAWKLNEFLGLPIEIESDFLDVSVEENLDLMGKTLCDDIDFVWGKRAFIRQSELTKVSAFWHLFVCANLIVSTNVTELNREKIRVVYALVTSKPINLGQVLIEQIENVASSSRLEKKLAFPGFISHYCLAMGLKDQEGDVFLPPLDKISEKRLSFMSYKGKGAPNDTIRLFDESCGSSLVPSAPILPLWALLLTNRVEKSERQLEEAHRKIEELNARVELQDEKIKELERNASTPKHYVRSSNRSIFLGGKEA